MPLVGTPSFQNVPPLCISSSGCGCNERYFVNGFKLHWTDELWRWYANTVFRFSLKPSSTFSSQLCNSKHVHLKCAIIAYALHFRKIPVCIKDTVPPFAYFESNNWSLCGKKKKKTAIWTERLCCNHGYRQLHWNPNFIWANLHQ